MKDDIDNISQFLDPSIVLREKILLSWSIKNILLSKILIFDLIGVP